MKTDKSRRLINDIGLFAVASFGPKLLSFFLVPLYTSCLTTTEYGIYDLLSTITSLLLPILMVDISDAIMLFTIENKKTYKENQPLRLGTKILVISTGCLVVTLLLISPFLKNNYEHIIYGVYIILNYFTLSFYNNMLAYLRGQDKVKTVVSASIINSTITLVLNVVFIIVFNSGLYGLLIANIIGTLSADIYMSFSIHFLKTIQTSNSPSREDTKAMLAYSVPLIFTGLAWWVNDSSDRLFISIFSGVSANGIYAIANKIPTILTVCHSIVYQAMQLSVFKEIHSDDKNEYLESLYEIYSFIMITVCSALIIMDKLLAKFLFKGDFYIAWKYSPALLISIVFFSISGYLTTIYAAEKETKLIAKATVGGAIVNVLLNILLIPSFELYGAVIATLTGYFVIWLTMAGNAKAITGVSLPIVKNIVCCIILVAQWILLLLLNNSYPVQFLLLFVILILNFKTLCSLIKGVL